MNRYKRWSEKIGFYKRVWAQTNYRNVRGEASIECLFSYGSRSPNKKEGEPKFAPMDNIPVNRSI